MKRGPLTAGVVLLLGLFCASHASAQLPWRWFGSKSNDAAPPAKPPLPDARRVIAINVEVAWLADPVTFPYYLEARVNATQQLEVRGYVPNKTVREHAVRTAQVYSSMPVVDSMKEHASLLVRPSPMSATQLQSSVLSSLKVALPKQYQQLKVDCSKDGKVYVVGPVSTFEEKLAVSHALRRLHGCTSVQNMTTVPMDLAQAPPTPAPVATPPDNKSKSWFPWSTAKTTTTQEPPLLEPRKLPPPPIQAPVLADTSKNPTIPVPEVKGPVLADASKNADSPPGPLLIFPVGNIKEKKPEPETKGPPEIVNVGLPTPLVPPKPAESEAKAKAAKPEPKGIAGVVDIETPAPPVEPKLTPEELRKRIQTVCPKATNIVVTFTSATDVRIVVDARSENDINPIAEIIFAMPELQNYHPDLQCNIAMP